MLACRIKTVQFFYDATIRDTKCLTWKMPQIVGTLSNFTGYEEKTSSCAVTAKWCITMYKYCLSIDLSGRVTVVKRKYQNFSNY